MTEPTNTEPVNTQTTVSLAARIQRKAIQSAKELAESFDFKDCFHAEYFRFDGDEKIRITGEHVSRGEINVTLDELGEAIKNFLEDELPGKIEALLIDNLLSGERSDIDVTELWKDTVT